MRRLLVTLLIIIATAAGADPVRDIDKFINRALREFPDVPSLGVAVVRNDTTLVARAYGYRDVEKELPATGDTVYYIASSTKSYVGLLTAVLAQRGEIDLDAPISRYLTELRLPDGVDTNRVTLRALLSHTSGIANDAIVMRTAFTGDHSPEALIGALGRSKRIEPKFSYDNLGYVVASLVLERVTGRKWQDLLQTEVFAPLKMTRTTAYMSRTADWPVATPYTLDADGNRKPLPMLKTDMTMHAAGGLVTTPKDLARWLLANINQKGLPAAAFAETHKQQAAYQRTWYRFATTGYGLGWNLANYEGADMLYHFGGFEGWRAHVSFLPKERIGVAVVTNTGGPGAPLRDVVAAYIYDRLLGKPDLDKTYEAQLAKLRKDHTTALTRYRADVDKRRERKPSLVRDLSSYEGRFTSDDFGTLNIVRTSDGLRASIGQLSGVLEPFTEPDTARVELIPGTGEVLRFKIGDEGRAEAVVYNDYTFTRIK